MDDMLARLQALNDPEKHAKTMASLDATIARLDTLAAPERHATTMASLEATNASLATMVARSKTLPSWPEMARMMTTLTAELAHLKERVTALEEECDALRQRELHRLWEQNGE